MTGRLHVRRLTRALLQVLLLCLCGVAGPARALDVMPEYAGRYPIEWPWVPIGEPIVIGERPPFLPFPEEEPSLAIGLNPVVDVREEQGTLLVPIVLRGWTQLDTTPPKFEIVTMDGTAKAGSDYMRPQRVQSFIVAVARNPIWDIPLTNVVPDVTLFTKNDLSINVPSLTVDPTIIWWPPYPRWPRTFTMNVAIPILNPPNTANEAMESFTVAIRPAKGSKIPIHKPALITVRITDSVDNKPPPPPLITRPASVLPKDAVPGSAVVLSGVATDNAGVSAVDVILNGEVVGGADLSSYGKRSTLFTKTIYPREAINEVVVTTRDLHNQRSAPAKHTFRFRVTSPLTVTVDHTLASLRPVDFIGTTMREAGEKYSLTVAPQTPSPDEPTFQRWIVDGVKLQDIGVTPAALLKPTLSFIHQPGLKLTALFIPNLYPRGTTTFNAVLRSTSEKLDRSNATSGFLSIALNPSGSYSARGVYHGDTFRLIGSFGKRTWAGKGDLPDPTYSQTGIGILPRLGNSISLTLRLRNEGPLPYIECAVSEGIVIRSEPDSMRLATSYGEARQALFDGVEKAVPSVYLGANGTPGFYTSTMYAYNYPGLPKLRFEEFPQASGVANMAVAKNGTVSYYGRLSDDTPFAVAGVIVDGMRCPFFAPLYDHQGFLTSELAFKSPGGDSDASGSPETWWCRPQQDEAMHYPKGWPQSLHVDLLTAKFPHKPDRTIFYHGAPDFLNLNPPRPEGSLAIFIDEFSPVPPESPFPKRDTLVWGFLNVANDGTVTKAEGGTGVWSMQVDATTGRLFGTFDHPDGTRPEFHGVIYQYGNNSYAHGYFVAKKPKPGGGTGAVYVSPLQYGAPP